MSLIKNAMIYRISLPSAEALAVHLAEIQFREITELESSTAGFVPTIDGEMVSPFDGGLAFSLRYDTKILPASVIKTELSKRVKIIEDMEERRVGRKERRELRDMVTADLLRTSHVSSKVITSFYHIASRTLIVPVSSPKLAAVVTSLLVRAVGAAKTETIHVSDVKGGLTTRLSSYLANFGRSEDFGEFELSPEVWLKGEQGKVTFQVDSIETGDQGITEALHVGMQVIAVRLGYGPVSFKLASDFTFKGVRFSAEGEPAEFETESEYWRHESGVQVFSLVQAIEALCALFDYKAPDLKEAA